MSDQKKTASAKSDKKLNESLKGLSAKQRSEALAEQKEHRKWKLYGVLTIIVIVLIAALLFWDSGFIQKRTAAVKVGDKTYTAAELDYYFYEQYNSIYYYASYYGLDTSVSLKEQEAYDGQTWYEYIRDNAEASLEQISILAQEAEAEGYTISEDGQANIDEALQSVADSAKENNVSQKYYLKRVYGRYMTPAIFEKVITEYCYASDYQQYKTEGFDISDDEVSAYYEENKDTIDTFDYLCYRINALPETQTDEDGNEISPTEEECAAAAAEAKALADQLEAAMKENDEDAIADLIDSTSVSDYSSTPANSFSSYVFGEWLTDSSRKAGDTTTVEDTTEITLRDNSADSEDTGDTDPADTDPADSSADSSAEGSDAEAEATEVVSCYYVLQFNDRYRDDYYAGTIRSILVSAPEVENEDETTYDYDSAKAQAEGLKQLWQDNGGNEDAFAALTEESEDADEEEASEDEADSSAAGEDEAEPSYSGTLSESVAKGSLGTVLDDWLYGQEHKAGDCEILEDTDNQGYQLVYFVGYDDMYYWQSNAISSLQSDAYSDWYDGVKENYETTETWFYSQVG